MYLFVGEIAGEVKTAGHVTAHDGVGFVLFGLAFHQVRHREGDLTPGAQQGVLGVARRFTVLNILRPKSMKNQLSIIITIIIKY